MLAASRMRCHVSSGGLASTSAAAEVAMSRPVRSRSVRVRAFQQQAAPSFADHHAANKVRLSFKLPYRCDWGQELCIVGSGEALGNWSVEHARRMEWTDGDVWQVDFEVTAGPEVELEYKYVVRCAEDGGVLEWKPGDNCQIRVPVRLEEEVAEGVLVHDAWDGSIHDIELAVTGCFASGTALGGPEAFTAFTAEQERAAVESAVDRALHELTQAMTSSVAVQGNKLDPTAPEVLQADRLVAAAARKAVAMHRALEASRALQQLPGGSEPSSSGSSSSDLLLEGAGANGHQHHHHEQQHQHQH